MTEQSSHSPEGAAEPELPAPVAPFRPPAWGRALGVVVLALMFIAAIFSIWVMYTYWDRISV